MNNVIREALDAVEWSGYVYDCEYDRCPLCGGFKEPQLQIAAGHDEDCLIAAALLAIRTRMEATSE